jgi:hypothetical protein
MVFRSELNTVEQQRVDEVLEVFGLVLVILKEKEFFTILNEFTHGSGPSISIRFSIEGDCFF